MFRLTILAAALALAGPAAAAAPPAAKPGDTVTVKREGVRLMKAARFYGASCTQKIAAGQKVKIAERQKAWARIEAPGAGKCWLHESAWSDREAGELASSGQGSQRDLELAARGFSEDEEKKYRGEKPDLAPAFKAIDAHVAAGAEPPPEEMEKFAAEGGVGGAP